MITQLYCKIVPERVLDGITKISRLFIPREPHPRQIASDWILVHLQTLES